jgi:hypothetical protein
MMNVRPDVAILHQPLGELDAGVALGARLPVGGRLAGRVGVAGGERATRVRDRHHHVRLDAGLLPELPPELAADLVHEVLVDDGVGAREVDVFEEAVGGRLALDELVGVVPRAVGVEDDELARAHVPDQLAVEGVDGGRLAGEHVAAVHLPEA